MKKLLALLLVLLLGLSCVSALAEEVVINEDGEVENPEAIVAGDNELIFWSLFSGGEGAVMEQIVADYNATNPDYTVRNVMLDWGEYYTKLVTAVAVGKGPDIGVSHIAKLPELYENGVVMPLDEAAEAIGFDWSQVNENTLAGAIIDGATYAMPLDTHPNVMYYNKGLLADYLDENGNLIVPQGEEFYSWLLEVKEKLPEDKYVLSFPTTADDPFRLFWGLYYQKEAAPVITSDLEITLEKDKTIEVLEYMKKFYDDGLIPLNLEDYIAYFTAGNAALCIGGVWNTFTMENQTVVDFGVTLIPQVFETYAIWGDSHTMIMPTKDTTEEKKEACMKFFDFLSKNSITWATAGHVVANVNIVGSEEFAALPNRSDYASAADYVVFFEPTQYNYPIRDAMIAQIGAYLSGNQDAEQTYDAIIEEIEAIIF